MKMTFTERKVSISDELKEYATKNVKSSSGTLIETTAPK